MRRFGVLMFGLVSVASSAGLSSPLMAQDLVNLNAGLRADALAALAPEFAEDPMRTEILREITRRKARAGQELSRQLDELGTLYASEFTKPQWIDADGLTIRAGEVLAELDRADDWGLEPAAFRVRIDDPRTTDPVALAEYEIDIALAALTYASHARGGRFNPSDLTLWYERSSPAVDGVGLLRELATASSPATVLTAQHPPHPQFHALRKALLKMRGKYVEEDVTALRREPEVVRLPSTGPMLAVGVTHPDVALLRQRLQAPAGPGEDENYFDAPLGVALRDFQRQSGLRADGLAGPRTRAALNGEQRPAVRSASVSERELLVNMEKWRWLPRELGDMHIWNNLPAFETKVVRGGTIIHQERIIVGKESTQTPVFSDTMTHVVFKPQWGVPNSIKVKSLLPRLAGGDYDVLRRRGMSIRTDDGRILNPRQINWSRTDIRSIPIVQGAGPSNPLGNVKFMFPNHHAVYMHDTPDRHLFSSSHRTFSAGCIRVRNPVRLAEVIFAETAGWSASDVAAYFSSRAQEDFRVDLPTAIPVHNTYFTVIAHEDGSFEKLKDVYGHDQRIAQAMAGRSVDVIARNDPARAQKQMVDQLARSARGYRPNFGEPRPRVAQRPRAFQDYSYSLGGPAYYVAPAPKKKVRRTAGPPKRQQWQLNPYQAGGFGW